MGYYVITNGNGSYIRYDASSKKYVPIRSSKQAAQWDNIGKATAVLNNSIAKSIRSGYSVQFIGTEPNSVKDETVQKKICSMAIVDDSIDDWAKKLTLIADIMQGSDKRKDELNERLSEIDKKKIDIEHYIEFGRFNAYQGFMCFKMLQNVLQQRRKYKNELEVINLIKNCRFDRESIVSLSKTVSEIRNKKYSPRILPELFKSK